MGIFDKQGNPIGDGRHHVKEHVYEFNEYPQISAKVTKSLTTETTYVKYYNSENGKSITVRFSNHVSNAVLFGDQLNGYTAKRDEILFYLGLKKRTLIPNTRLHIWTQSVAKKKLNDYEYTDKTIGDLYELGEGADISKHKGKIAKGSNYLILGDSVEKVIDKKINSLGQKVVLGEYVYSDISVSDEKFKRGGEITPDVCVNYIKKTESILRNGYYSDHGLFYLITYNSGGGEGLNVYQTVNYDVIDRLAFFLGFSDTTAGVILLKHYEDARRFDSLDVLKEIKNKPVIIVDRDTIVCSNYDRKKAKLKEGGEVSDEMENFDWDSIYDIDGSHGDSDTKKEPKYDIDKIKSLIDQKIDSEKAVIEDWSNRNYKSNKGIVYTGGDDIHGTPLQIGSINESRRRNKINSAERVISELSLAKDIVEKYRGNESDLYNIVLDDYRKNYYRGYKPSSHKRDYKAEQRYSDAYDLLINTVKESETFKSGGEVNKETKMDKPKNNVALYTRVKGEKQFRASDFKGNQVDRLVNAPLVSPDKFDEFLKAVKDTAEQNKGVDFRIKEFGTNKIWYDSQLSKGTEVESNKHEELPYGEIIIVEHSLKSGANVRDAYITVRKDSPFVIQFKNRHVYCLKFRKINNEEWTFYNVAVGFTKKEFDELKEGSIKHTMENTMKFVSTEKRIIEKLLIYELDYLSEKGYMLAPLFIDTYGTTYSVEKLDDDGYYFVNESFTKRGKQLENNNPISYYADTATTVFEAIDKKYKKAKEDELSKGAKVELEHKDTIEEIASGKLSPEEGAKEIAKDHIAEDPAYYDKLEKVEGKKNNSDYVSMTIAELDNLRDSVLDDANDLSSLYKSRYGSMDIESPMSSEEKELKSKIANLLSVANEIVMEKRKRSKEIKTEEMKSPFEMAYRNDTGLISPVSIVINESRPFSNWNEANESTKWLISQQVWSNLPYKIEFQDGFILEGTIDAEPYSFWKDKKNPLTWHLNTFWGNLARATANPIYDQESIDYAKKVVTKYNIGQDISTDVDNSDVTPPESEDAEVVSSAKQDVIKKLLKEKKTAYNFVYDRLLKVAPDLLRLLNEAEYTSDVYGKSQYRTQDFGGNDAFMYLAIEGLDKDEQGRYELSISHYYKQHGDMMCDPCMTVRLDPELKTVEALTFKMDGIIGRGIIKSVYGTTKEGKPGVNIYEKKDQNSFLNKWSSNWVKQGHKVEFRPLPEKEVSGTPISAEAQAVIQPEWDKMQDFLAGKEAKASDRKNENEIKREKYPIVVEWSEGSTDENIGFENLEQLEIWLEQIGFTETPDETYIKNKVWFRGMTSYVRIDLSRKDGDFNPQEKSLIEYLIENVSESFDWQALSEAKTPIVQDANFTYFKGIAANYENQFKLNKAIEEFLDSRPDDYVYSNEEKEFIITYEGYGGLEKQGATGIGLLFEYYTPLKLIEKMWGLAYKYGFNTGKVLEPSVGVGRFLNYTGKTDVVKGYEINPYSAKICRIIHPKANIILSSFAEHFYKGNVFNPKFEKDFDLVIGNPPYGKMTDLRTHGENSRIGVSISQYEHYFILRGLDCLKSGGLLIYVSTANLATKGYEKIKEKIFEKADLVDCYLLPNTTFKQTKVNTSLIVLRRK